MSVHKGLEGVVAYTSAVSLVEGLRGELSYRGYTIGSLVNQPFAAVASLVALDRFDMKFGERLTTASALSPRETAMVLALPAGIHPMHVLQGLTPLLDRSSAFAEQGEAAQGFAIA